MKPTSREYVASPQPKPNLTRRDFLARSGAVVTGSALAGVAIPHVHAAGDNTIHLALIGCGGRGSGAATNAFDSPNCPVKMVAMADLFQDRLEKSLTALTQKYAAQMDVPRDRRFVGFDAYKKAIDCLHPGDVAMLTGYSAFRPCQLEYAESKGINVFMEKSFGPDAPALRRVIKAGEERVCILNKRIVRPVSEETALGLRIILGFYTANDFTKDEEIGAYPASPKR